MSFAAAEQNFHNAARDGIESRLYWPGFGEVRAEELVLRHLLPMAHEGLADWGVSQAVRDRYLSVIEGRCKTSTNGATWQTAHRRTAGTRRDWTGRRRWPRCCGSTPSSCTATNPCTPGRSPEVCRARDVS